MLSTRLFSTDQLLKLDELKIKTRDQLADLSNSELIEIFKDMDKEKADEIKQIIIYTGNRVMKGHIGTFTCSGNWS